MLSPRTRLGPYEILAPLGAGGMGEVYRATDTTLSRDVAIKVLPAEVAADPERLARFKREAQLLAALNHPNIAAIHGLDESEGKPFLILELVEGDDLAQRLKRGSMPVEEALAVAKQVAWAFGCVLYELLAGKPAFGGETVTDCLAAIMTKEADWSALPTGSPLPLLRRCLQKDPRLRLRDIGDAFPAGEPLSDGAQPDTLGQRRPWRRAAPWMAAVPVAILAGAAGMFVRQPPPASLAPVRATLTPPAKATLSLSRGSAVALSPDGRRVVFIAASEGRTALYQRPLDQLESTLIRGTEGASNPFFSPDGHWLGFFAEGKLKRVALQGGGEPVSVCDAETPRGQAWAADDTIFLTPTSSVGVFRVPAAGGKPQPVTEARKGEYSHRWPAVLPGGRALLFTVWNDTGFEDGRIFAQRLDTGERRLLVQGGSHAQYAPPARGRPGHLIYARAGGLMAVPFDADGLRITGTAIPILEDVATNFSGGAHFGLSPGGTLVYLAGGMSDVDRSLVWLRPDGTRESEKQIPGLTVSFRLSPDGRRLVRSNPMGPARDLWIYDFERETSTRFTYGPNDNRPLWSPDGKRIAYSAGLPTEEIVRKPADGSGAPERLLAGEQYQFPSSFSRDGKLLAYERLDPGSGSDIFVIPLEGDRTPQVVVKTPFSEQYPDFSPDGKWLAYQSNEPGHFEIFVQSHPPGGGRWQVSTDGGQFPHWSKDGKTIYYRNRNAMMAASLRLRANGSTPELLIDKPRVLFEGSYELWYELAPDGRFAMIPLNPGRIPAAVNLVLNWFEDARFRTAKN